MWNENAYINDALLAACAVAIESPFAYHAKMADHITMVGDTVNLRFSGSSTVSIQEFDTEHAPVSGGWTQTTYDVDDPSNLGNGRISWHTVLGGTGVVNTFIKNGAMNLAIDQLDNPSLTATTPGAKAIFYTSLPALTFLSIQPSVSLPTLIGNLMVVKPP